MNNKGFFKILLSTTITLLILSALFFYIISNPKESLQISGQAAKAIVDSTVETFKKTNSSNVSISSLSKPMPEKKENSVSIVGRAIQE